MKAFTKSVKNKLISRQGMTLVEVLVAMTLLMLIIFTFTPLFAQYYRNIHTSGEITQRTYERASIIERLLANRGDNFSQYETEVANVPLTLTTNTGESIQFNATSDDKILGYIITSDYVNGGEDTYSTFYTNSASSGMYCFPNSLTDDFLTTQINIVARGFKFCDISDADDEFTVFYTNSVGNLAAVPSQYYDILSTDKEDDTVAEFEFKGGNNTICFDNSPIVIKYGPYEVEIEIGAPNIIMVGEKASDGGYYYYATSGVKEDGTVELIAKKMTSTATTADLTSAMNDVEWVEKGKGDDGNGGVNEYGYYIMGGDAGQVRRFWRNGVTGNYYWGGDKTIDYNRYVYYNTSGTIQSGSYETMTPTAITDTDVSFKNIFRSDGRSITYNGISKANAMIKSDLMGITNQFEIVARNYFTANVTSSDYAKFSVTLGAALKIKNLIGTKFEYYGCTNGASDSENGNLATFLVGNDAVTISKNLNASGYKDATNYEYASDNSLVTITSVGAIIITDNAYMSQASSTLNANVYPTQSYTLYCGYIPAVVDAWGINAAATSTKYLHVGTIGAAYSSSTNSWYPVGKFGDTKATATSALSTTIFTDRNWKSLLNYVDGNTSNKDTIYPYPGSNNKWYYYKAGVLYNGIYPYGIALPSEGNDYYISSAEEVDVTVGYLSHPYAINIQNPSAPYITGATGSDFYFGGIGSNYNHSFFGAGLRDFVTLLDVKSYYDDINDTNLSLGVGYTLSLIGGDYSWYTRLNQVYNTGIVYIRATGDGTSNDTTGSMDSGKGWSLGYETNVFHQFYGIDQYVWTSSSLAEDAARGWKTQYHKEYYNISNNSNKAPQPSYSPSRTTGSSSYGTNSHPLSQTECNTVNWGSTWDGKPQAMWGTENGTVLSWYYDYETPVNSKITSVTKQFESYRWVDFYGSKITTQGGHYDYESCINGNSGTYGFVSVLKSVNAIAYGDDYWVAVGDQSQKAPSSYCASSSCYTGTGNVGSYLNVKRCIDTTNNYFAWRAIKFDTRDNVNLISITYCEGIWYAVGFVDTNKDGVYDQGEAGVMYYASNPDKLSTEDDGGWRQCATNSSGETIAKYYNSTGTETTITLQGINAMASQG